MKDNLNFVPNEEQKAIFDFILHGKGDAVINACAGSGKSTTILESIKYIDVDKSVLFISFNKSIVDELKKRVKEMYGTRAYNIHIYTFHGLGYRFFQDKFGEEHNLEIINDNKYLEFVHKHIDEVGGQEYYNLKKADKIVYKRNVLKLIDYSRQNLAQSEKEINRIAKKYNIDTFSNEVTSVVKILAWGRDNLDSVDFLDLIWLPTELGYGSRRFLSDFIFIDEAQDTSMVQQSLIKKCFKRNTRMIAVGDKYQTINAWCGSDQEAFEHIKELNEGRIATDLYLSTSYRCPKKLVDMASKIAPNIKAKDDAIDGEYNICVKTSKIKNGDMVLCRNMEPLISFHRKLILDGKKAYIRNVEFGETLKRYIDLTDCVSSDDILSVMENTIIDTWKNVTSKLQCDEKESVTDSNVTYLYEIYNIIKDLSKIYTNKDELKSYIEEAFFKPSDVDKNDYIMLSTIHRAKGLENENVYVICPSLVPSPLAKKEWEIESEQYLKYVMITRARKSLNMIDEAEIHPNLWFSNSDYMYKELKKIRNKIQNKLINYEN